jgi:transposase InsO family protein
MPKASKGGSRYLATFLDDYSKLSVVQPLKKKSNVAAVTEGVQTRLELQTGKKVKAVQTDRGGEYVNEEMTTLLSKRSITQRKTTGYSPEQNGSAERLNRDLQEKGRAMLEDSGLGEEMWAKAMVTLNYTRNRLPSRVHGKTPWEKFFGEKPDVSHMRVFGARAYMHIPKENRKKMQSVSERGVFVGYELDCKAYRVLQERDGRILVSRDVIVNEKPAFGTIELNSGSKKGGGGCS